jgi:hypothetical protein
MKLRSITSISSYAKQTVSSVPAQNAHGAEQVPDKALMGVIPEEADHARRAVHWRKNTVHLWAWDKSDLSTFEVSVCSQNRHQPVNIS